MRSMSRVVVRTLCRRQIAVRVVHIIMIRVFNYYEQMVIYQGLNKQQKTKLS